jgi:hypothetical protein
VKTPIGILTFINKNNLCNICPTAVNPIAINPAGSKNQITDNEYTVEDKITIIILIISEYNCFLLIIRLNLQRLI